MIDWLSVALTKKVGYDKSPLSMPRPTAPLDKGDCLCHHHHMFTQHIPRLDRALQRVQGLLIATHIGEVTVKMRRDIEVKVQSHNVYDEKGVLCLLGTNLTYTLCIRQVSAHEYLPPIWKDIAGGPKRQHMKRLQKALDDTACFLRFHAPIVVMPGLIKLTLALGFSWIT